MKAWLALLRREGWEHAAGFSWTPLAMAGVLSLLAFYLLFMASGADVQIAFHSTTESNSNSMARNFAWNDALLGLLDFASRSTPELERALQTLLHLVAQPFVYAHFLVALFVLPGMLNDDRRDRSVLFWKSLPVSDLATVTSKLVFVVWAAPIVTVTAILATWLAVLTLVSAFAGSADAAEAAGATVAARVWTHAGLVSSTSGLVVGYLLQGLWTLPVYAWLLLVSAAVPRGPLVWSALLPLIPVALERMFLGSNALWSWISAHVQFVALPRPPALSGDGGPGAIGFAEQLALAGSLDLWAGVAAGVVMLYAATWFRARSYDL